MFGIKKKVTIYMTHDRSERDLFAKRLTKAGIWNQTRQSEGTRQTASFGSNFVDVQRFAGNRDSDNRDYYIDVHAGDEQKARGLLGPKCRILKTGLI